MPSVFLLLSPDFFQIHLFWDELGSVPSVLVDVTNHAGTHAHQLALGQQKHRFQLGMESFVGMTDHVLILEVAAAAEATDDEPCTHLFAEVGGETVVTLHKDSRQRRL